MKKNKSIYIAGHRGMVGSALVRKLKEGGYQNIICKSRQQLDLKSQSEVEKFFKNENIDQVVIAAAKVGGIHANRTYPADFLYENLMIEANIINSAYENKVSKLLFLGSSCIYPRLASQPMDETQLLTGALEPTNEAYAIAKIAGIKLCESYNMQHGTDYRSAMPTNLFGPNDNFDLESSHVIPALIRKIHTAKIEGNGHVEVWGSGKPHREFLYVDDLADGCIHLMNMTKQEYQNLVTPTCSQVNIGSAKDISINELVGTIAETIGFLGEIVWNTNMPDGTPKKLLNSDRIKKSGWKPKVSLIEGLHLTYDWFLKNESTIDRY